MTKHDLTLAMHRGARLYFSRRRFGLERSGKVEIIPANLLKRMMNPNAPYVYLYGEVRGMKEYKLTMLGRLAAGELATREEQRDMK